MSNVSKLKRFFEEGAFPSNDYKNEVIEVVNVQLKEEEHTSSKNGQPVTIIENPQNELEINSDDDQHYETIVENDQDAIDILEELDSFLDEEKCLVPPPNTGKTQEKPVPPIRKNPPTEKFTNIYENNELEITHHQLTKRDSDEDHHREVFNPGNIVNVLRISNTSDNNRGSANQDEFVEIRNGSSALSLLGNDWHTRSTKPITQEEENDCKAVKNTQEICGLIESLKYSESKYLDDLKGVVSVYLFTIKRHSSELIKARSDVLIQRVENLLECQKKFGSDLISVHSIDDLSDCFNQHTQLIHFYEEFLVDELGHITTVIAEVGTSFKKEVSLKDMLTSRLSDYNVALKEIATLSDNDVDLKEPIKRVTQVFTSVKKSQTGLKSDKLEVLQFNRKVPSWVFTDCSLDDSFGNYLLKNTFAVSSDQDDNVTFTVHLYSKVMLFTKENEDSYYYQKHISMEEIGQPCIEPPAKKKPVFSFVHYTNSARMRYKFKKTSKETAQLWLETIEDLLKKQQENLIKERQVPQLN